MAAFLFVGFCLLCLTVHEAFPERICAPQDVLDYLNLNRHNEKFTNTRPVLDWTHPTEVQVDVYLSAILSVIEKSQMFVSCLWLSTRWNNELISWNPEDFCGINQVSLPREMLWKPDLSIFELTEKEDGPQCPYLYISHDGKVTTEDIFKIVSTCQMDVHKFPFDTQSCNMTISSVLHSNSYIKLMASSNSSKITQSSRQILMSQGEWELLDVAVTKGNFTYSEGVTWDLIRYTITMRRLPLQHVLNFQIPVLFFLVLDLASFFIPETKGDKISFKVTLLLAISVLLLILTEILPSKSNHSPLIATYIIFIFAFMMLSLLETIFVTYLAELNPASEDQFSVNTHKYSTHSLKFADLQNGTITSEKGKKRRQGSNSHISSGMNSPVESLTGMALSGAEVMTDVNLLQLISGQLQALRENVSALTFRDEDRDRYWRRVAKRIDAAFFVFYISSSFLFLIIISLKWIE